MKKKRGLNINIKLSNRWLYFLITLGILIIAGVGVYAYGTSSPTIFGHSAGELDFSGIGTEVIPSSAILFNSQIATPSMSHPWISLQSGNGGSAEDFAATISLGESGPGSSSLHLTYVQGGYAYIGMGTLIDNVPYYYAMRMYRRNNNVYFPGSVSVDGRLTADLGRNSIYRINAYCTNSGLLTTSSTCSTRACGTWNYYYTCSGSCSSSGSVVCSNTHLGSVV